MASGFAFNVQADVRAAATGLRTGTLGEFDWRLRARSLKNSRLTRGREGASAKTPAPRMTAAQGTGVHALVQVARTAELPTGQSRSGPFANRVNRAAHRGLTGRQRLELPQRLRRRFQGEKRN